MKKLFAAAALCTMLTPAMANAETLKEGFERDCKSGPESTSIACKALRALSPKDMEELEARLEYIAETLRKAQKVKESQNQSSPAFTGPSDYTVTGNSGVKVWKPPANPFAGAETGPAIVPAPNYSAPALGPNEGWQLRANQGR
jgi:hypothetical protein